MNPWIVPLAAVLGLAACREPVAPPAPTPPVAATKAPTKPAATRPEVKRGALTTIDLATLFPRQQEGSVLIYDARPSFVATFGKIPGAISWPRGDYDARLSQREAEIRAARQAGKPVVIYCTDAACPDARAIAEKLAARGHDVAILTGGFAAWKEAGLPTE